MKNKMLTTSLIGIAASLALTAPLLLGTIGCGGESLDVCVPYTKDNCPAGESGCFDDGCGGLLDCGGCGSATCLTHCPSGACGSISDNCGGTLDCGPCGECLTACPTGACGTIGDNCGGTLYCGSCGCQKKTCAADYPGKCGAGLDDGCGGTIDCGCGAPDSCVAGTCTCTPLSCADQGNPNGEAYDGCGHFIRCSGGGASTEIIRIVAANLTSTGALRLSDGTEVNFSETWDPGPGQRILQGLKPQVALIQEFKTLFYEKDRTGYYKHTDASLRDFVKRNFGDRYYAYRENRTGKNLGKPNGIVSYYPIKAAGEFSSALENIQDRQHVWARIDIPGDKDLWVVSVHITTGTNSDYGAETTQRVNDVKGLVSNIKSLNIPSGDYLVIGGDFNTSSRSEKCLNALSDSGLVYVDTESDCPIDQQQNGDTNAKRNSPYDMVLTSENLRNLRTKPVIGSASNLTKRGVVIDTARFTPLSAIAPAQKADSDASDMQHMAVLKDFAIPR